MKIVILGGTGLIGRKLVNLLRSGGHEVIAASPSRGINSITGEGLTEALTGAQVVVDVTNAPSWEDKAVLEFFETSTRNVLAAEAKTGVGHHIALSIVGCDQLPASGYLRAKVTQENLIKASGIPFTIVRSTQFFEFAKGIVQSATEGQTVRLSPALFQPIAADDVAAALTGFALAEPLNGTVEIAGPEPIPMDEFARRFLRATRDPRKVTADVHACYFGTELNDQSLIPGDNAPERTANQREVSRFHGCISRAPPKSVERVHLGSDMIGQMAILRVHVVPNAKSDSVVGMHGGAVKIKLRAPAVEGKANAALVRFLAEQMKLPRHAIVLQRGHTSRDKLIRVDGLNQEDVRRCLLENRDE